MSYVSIILTIVGLAVFETISSIDNAIINAQVLETMHVRYRRWFLTWGVLVAIFLVRGILPWLIIWLTVPSLGPIGAITATFSSNPEVGNAITASAPILLGGGGMFLILLFLNWLFLESKNIGLRHERFFLRHGSWFYASASLILALTVWFALKTSSLMAFGIIIGSTLFFITHGFKQYAEEAEKNLAEGSNRSDWSKILYLEIIDATFSIDGVLGAFAFTLSIPLILIGNGIGAIMVRQMTVSSIDRIKKYLYLKNGAMYSILVLDIIMFSDAFGYHVPEWVSPVMTFLIVGFFYIESRLENRKLV